MIAENVTLIVKAPNQQIEDQNIECQSSWTVRQLKGHLSEVYPSKPSTEDQKIIYSGQLLDDNTVLKDVLRTYESQLGHIMHLVCAPNNTMSDPSRAWQEMDGLRQRNVATENPEPATRPEMRQNDQNHTVEIQNYMTSFVNNYGRIPPYPNYNIRDGYLPVPNDQTLIANHMLMMQQLYMRYMQHYANMWQAEANTPSAPVVETPPAPPAQDPPAVAGNDDEEHQHDWLDHIYSASRLAILFSLIYFYGSPARLLLVIMIAAAAYLHQIGFFRELFVNDDNANPNRAAQRNQQPMPQQPNAQQPNAQQPAQQLIAQPQVDQPEPQPSTSRAEINVSQTEQRAPSIFAVSWMVVTSFFTSLIPDMNQ